MTTAATEPASIASEARLTTATAPEKSVIDTQPAEPASGPTASSSSSEAFPTGTYPKPKSSYYFGPPEPSRAFGSPFVPGSISKYLPREIVRIERDYSAGELPQFHPSFPLELEGRITPTTFSEIVNDINLLLIDAHNPTKTWLDNCLAVLTLYISSLILGSHYQRVMRKLDNLIDSVNHTVLNPAGLNLVHPRKTAFLFIEVEYY